MDVEAIKSYFTKRDDVGFAFLYGSQAKGNATQLSDFDMAKLILTSEGRSLPDTYKDIVKNLSLVGDFSGEDMAKLSTWMSLRNIISHEYLDIR